MGNREDNLIALIDGYFIKGGQHININVMSKENLIEARAHPELYPNGIVIRVLGYAVDFFKLTKEQQDEVISRTYHDKM